MLLPLYIRAADWLSSIRSGLLLLNIDEREIETTGELAEAAKGGVGSL
jgi:hypothetical protein